MSNTSFNDLINEGFVNVSGDGHLPKFLKADDIKGIFLIAAASYYLTKTATL